MPVSAPEKYLAKSTTVASRLLGDETIVMSTVDSTLFSLNPTASVIWEAADGTMSLSRIIQEKVCTQFDVTPEQAVADAEDLITELTKHGILVVSDREIRQY
jgi:hypothetical protein